MLQQVTRCGEHESGVQTPRKPIGRQGINENRARENQVFLRNLDAMNMNPRSKHREAILMVQEYGLRSITIQREVSISVF